MTNNATELSSSLPNDLPLLNQVGISFKIVLIFINFGGNILTISAICRFKTLRYPSNVMIAGLAVSDLLMGSLYLLLILISTYGSLFFKIKTSCLAIVFTGQSLILGNIVFQSTLSAERFYAVQFPYHYYSYVTIKMNLIWCAVAVAGIIFINIPVLCGIDLWSENVKCYSPTLFPRAYSRFYIGSIIVFQLVGVSTFIRVLVAELGFRRRDRNLQTSHTQKQTSVQSTIMVLAYGIALCFYMPHIFYYLWSTISKQKSDPATSYILQVFDLCSSAVNCFIYGFKNSKFREAYKKILGFKNSRVEPLYMVST